MGDGRHKFRNADGHWQEDRRKGDRRQRQIPIDFPDRRRASRRHLDEQALLREHKQMIEEALEEFSAEHGHGQRRIE